MQRAVKQLGRGKWTESPREERKTKKDEASCPWNPKETSARLLGAILQGSRQEMVGIYPQSKGHK